MSTITKEQLRERAREKVKSLEFAVTQAAFADYRAELEEELELARIALASLEAGPAIHRWRRVTSEPYGPYPWHYGDFIGFSKPVDGVEDEYFYSAPPAPVSDEDKVLAEQARAVIHCLDMCGVPSGDYADNEQLQLWGRVIEYGRHPAPISVPAAMEMDDDFDSAFEHGKAVGWNAYRAAMLQGADGALTDEDAKRVDELVMWIKRLAHSLRKANPDSKLQSDAMDYLSRKGLIGVEDILR